MHEREASAAGGDDRASVPGVRRQGVLKRHPFNRCCHCGPRVGQLALGGELYRTVGNEALYRLRKLLDRGGPDPLDQRRADGGLLPSRWPRGQARDPGGRTLFPETGGAPSYRCHRRSCTTGLWADLVKYSTHSSPASETKETSACSVTFSQ